MSRFIDITGHKYNRLTVLEKTDKKQGSGYLFKCQCDCGNIVYVTSNNLRNNHTKSCGCLAAEKLAKRNQSKSLIGQRFGKLKVISDSGKRQGKNIIYVCLCDCGNTVEVSSSGLKMKHSQSCGCSKSELIKIKAKEQSNLVGKTFGKLSVIERTDLRNHSQVVYKCQCECGGIIYTSSSYLTNGKTKSCGCINSSSEEIISDILENNNIKFVKQKRFNDCRDNKPLPFDFYVSNHYVIEYDGIQHYKALGGWGTEEHLLSVQRHDKIKNDYCKEHGIPIIRIPYTHKNICLEDLLLDTSKFVV